MYLSKLQEKEKYLFLESAQKLASVDGNFSDEENEMIEYYCQEMDILRPEFMAHKPEYELINEINDTCSIDVKRIFIFELIGLAISDGNYDETERCLINRMVKEFKFSNEYSAKCEEIIEEYLKFQERINNLVFGSGGN